MRHLKIRDDDINAFSKVEIEGLHSINRDIDLVTHPLDDVFQDDPITRFVFDDEYVFHDIEPLSGPLGGEGGWVNMLLLNDATEIRVRASVLVGHFRPVVGRLPLVEGERRCKRDGGCRFPGCGLRFCDAHHIKHWADGGETRLDNLVLLCRRHHRAVHEEGFGVEMVEDGEGGVARGGVRFHWPDGRPFPNVPPAPRLPDHPVRALEAENGRLGIDIDPETTTPRWNGERLDLGWAIHTLWKP